MSDPEKPPLSESMIRIGAAVRAVIEKAQAEGQPITDELIGQAVSDAMFDTVGKGGSFAQRMRRGKPPTRQ